MKTDRKFWDELKMLKMYVNSTLDYLRILTIIIILTLEGIAAYLGQTIPWFLAASIMISVLSLLNYLEHRMNTEGNWNTIALLLFLAMICCTIGDFLMAGVFYITPEPLINGVLMFGIAHILYLFALRSQSPLLLKKKQDGTELRRSNLVVWIASIITIVAIFFLTVYNSTMVVISIGLLGYGILLVTVIAFSIAKWFDDFPRVLPLLLFTGFSFFLFSDWLIGVHTLTDSNFLAGPWVGLTYILGLVLIHLSPWLGSSR